jgi:hypothetical protein
MVLGVWCADLLCSDRISLAISEPKEKPTKNFGNEWGKWGKAAGGRGKCQRTTDKDERNPAIVMVRFIF